MHETVKVLVKDSSDFHDVGCSDAGARTENNQQ